MKNKNTNFSYTTEKENQYKAIRDWREDERPRERLMKHGASSLSDAELLAILIGQGTIQYSALDVAKEILDKFISLKNLTSIDISQFKQIRGIGDAKAVSIAAAIELSRRIQASQNEEKKSIQSPEDIALYYIPKLMGARQEIFFVVLLDSANHIIREVDISIGSLNASIAHPREVFRIAITESAASIILLHNHPSGNPEPSKDDIAITKQLVEVGKLIDIKVIDHLIIAGNLYTSIARKGLIKFD